MFKVVYCKCGSKIVLSQCMPDAEQYKRMQEDVRELFNKGYTKAACIKTFKTEDFDLCFKCHPLQLEFDL